MIKAERESLTTCATCGKPAIAREVLVRHPGGERRVPYEIHAESTHERSHRDALERLDRFHESVIVLETALNQLGESERKLKYGRIIEFDIATIRPSACDMRTHIRPEALIAAFHQQTTVLASERPSEGQTLEIVLRDLKDAAWPTLEKMKAKFDRGDF